MESLLVSPQQVISTPMQEVPVSSQIVVTRGPLTGRTFVLGDDPLTFGRTTDNAVVIASPLSSRRHAEIRRDAGGYVLVDLGSSNGTTVAGRQIQTWNLQHGDEFAIGDEAFRFEGDAAGAAEGKTLIAGPAAVAPPPIAPQPQQPPPAAGQPQQPLPPLPGSATPGNANPGGFNLPPAAGAPAGAAQPTGNRSKLPLIIGIVVVVACIVVAGLAGGIVLLTRGNGIIGNPQPTADGGNSGGGIAAPAGGEDNGGGDAPPSEVAVAPTAPLPDNAAEWTVLVYVDGDNNLEEDAIIDFMEMSAIGSTDQVQIVAQVDRIASPELWDDTSYGNWTGTLRFLVEKDMEPTESAAIADLGEMNMGDEATLTDFIIWGVENYPARRYAVVLWDHGASWLGIASDDTDDGDFLTLPELSSAFENARQRTGVEKFDLIGFDACLMAQMDVLPQLTATDWLQSPRLNWSQTSAGPGTPSCVNWSPIQPWTPTRWHRSSSTPTSPPTKTPMPMKSPFRPSTWNESAR
jgi:hypothetical protein